jgi:hypothetical protein
MACLHSAPLKISCSNHTHINSTAAPLPANMICMSQAAGCQPGWLNILHPASRFMLHSSESNIIQQCKAALPQTLYSCTFDVHKNQKHTAALLCN